MSYSGGVIFGNVEIADVQRALGDGHQWGNDLCRSDNIAMWAKFRPVECKTADGRPIVKPLTAADRQRVNYGIGSIPIWNNKTLANVVASWVDGSTVSGNLPNGYDTPPRGGWWERILPTSVCRLTDFNLYFAGAKPPIGSIDFAGAESNGNVTINYNMSKEGVTAGIALTYSDLTALNNISFQNLYFGVIIVCGSTYYIATQDNTVGAIDGAGTTLWSMGAVVHFKVDSTSGDLSTYITNKTPFKVFPILTATKYYYGSTAISPKSGNTSMANTVALQEYETVTVGIDYTQPIILTISAYKNLPVSNQYVYYTFLLGCTEKTVQHYIAYKLYFLDDSGNILAQTTGSATVAAGGTVTVNSNFNVGQQFSGATQLKVFCEPSSTDTSAFKKSTEQTVPIQPSPSPYTE